MSCDECSYRGRTCDACLNYDRALRNTIAELKRRLMLAEIELELREREREKLFINADESLVDPLYCKPRP